MSVPQLSKGQTSVEDKNKAKQVERMVFMHWKKFDPGWYFNIFHRKYKKGDKRIILQLTPTLASLKLNQKESEKEKDDISDVHDYQVAQQANTIAESHYHLHYKKVFKKLDDAYDYLYGQCIDNQVSPIDMNAFEDERGMLHEYLKAVRKGNVVKGESAKAMTEIQKDYKRLVSTMALTVNLYEVKNKYSKIERE